jgi:succinate dehydrogenase / fumarate reductase membrane anchor subunit
MSLGDSASALGKVEHTGSARHGGEHWLSDKVLSAALLLLGAWFVASLIMLPALDQRTIVQWLRDPAGAIPMTLFVIASFRHALDGMKTVVDDYVRDEGNRFALNTVFYFLAVGGGALALFALARIAFGAQG